MKNVKVEISRNVIFNIFKGLMISFIVTLVSVLFFAIILVYSNVSEKTIPIVLIVLTFISILIGSIIGLKKTNKNGMINGGWIGGGYVILLYLISSILNTGFTLNIYTVFMIIVGIISGIIGGIIGVNI